MTQKSTYSVYGTTCSSCEIVIEREVRELPGIESVDVLHAKKLMTIHHAEGKKPSVKELKGLLSAHGYKIGEKNVECKEAETNSAPSWNVRRTGAILLLVVALYLLLKQSGLLTLTPNVESIGNLSGVFVVGLVAAFSSCTAVLSGLVAAVSASAAKVNQNASLSARMRPHYLFNFGRLAGFVAFGAIIGMIGQAVQLSAGANGLFVLVIALLMVGLGVNLLDLVPQGVAISPPKWLSHRIHDLGSSHHPGVPFALGAGTFFLPCGFTQAMQLFALSLGDPRSSAIVMGVFALGTLPALLGIGAITSKAKGPSLKKLTQVAGVAVLVLGISNIENSLALLDMHPSSLFVEAAGDAADIVVEGDWQVIEMDVTSRGTYEPSVLTVQEGVPVRWEITGADFMGCANTLMMREFGVNEHLGEGLNIVEFTPTKTGSFTFSCSMGMVRGTMHVVE